MRQHNHLDTFFQARIHKLLMHAFRSGKPSLKKEAIRMQHDMNIASNRQIRQAKILLFPGLWKAMRLLRNRIKNAK